MNMSAGDRLYPLVPAIYRLRDAAEGEPLRALLAVVEQELLTLEGNIDDLYENWFIETCDDWVVPYIGDLLDVPELYAGNPGTYGQQQRRAYIANTLAYRRRKGTTPVLEQLTRDVTDWRSRAVEFFQLLATTQNLNHLRPANTTVDLRAANQPDLVGTPFERQVAYTASLRRITNGQGQYNAPLIGLYLWRLQSYPLDRVQARRVAGADAEPTGRYYSFSPLGQDAVPLFNQPQTETDIIQLAGEMNLPAPLRRPLLARELQTRCQERIAGEPLRGIRYFDGDPVLQIFVDGQPEPIPPEEIWVTSLQKSVQADAEAQTEGDWLTVSDALTQDSLFPPKTVVVDPELGRLAFLDRQLPQSVQVSYLYGFSGDIGGGSYGRLEAPVTRSHPLLTWELEQASAGSPNPLLAAVQAWNGMMLAIQGLQDQTCIPLAEVVVTAAPKVAVSELDLTSNQPLRSRFKPGIVEGLEIVWNAAGTGAVIAPGAAVDRQGRRIAVEGVFPLTVQPYRTDSGQMLQPEHLLAIAYRPAQTGHRWQVEVLPETATSLEGFPAGSLIPLGRVRFDDVGKPTPLSTLTRRMFVAGIVQGLKVLAPAGQREAIVTAGTAVDARGKPLVFAQNRRVDLRAYAGRVRILAIATGIQQTEERGTLLLITSEERAANPAGYIPLAMLDVPSVSIEQITPLRTQQISGLQISLLSGAVIQITRGKAAVGNGQPLLLEDTCQLDLSAYTGQTLTLFIGRQPGLGAPGLRAVRKGRGWRQFGVVATELKDADSGLILLKDSATYSGDLGVVVPANRHLRILAGDGDRPHIHGNVSIWGAMPGTKYTATLAPEPGELTLNGLLIDGKLTILPGNLKRLTLHHCTLVPQAGGLTVERTPPPEPQEQPESDWTLIGLIFYCLTLLARIWQVGTQSGDSSPTRNLAQLSRLAVRQFSYLCTLIQHTVQDWSCLRSVPVEDPDDGTPRGTNPRLEITLNRCISGTLRLADTVPQLTIQDCLIDCGSPDGTRRAIAAPGTALDLKTTTVFGSTSVRSLEASDALFTARVATLRKQVGCVRFSYIPAGSETPRRYNCQPDRAIADTLNVLPDSVTAIAFFPNVPLLFMATAGGGVFVRSQTEPSTWTPVNTNLSQRHVTALLAYTRLATGSVRSDADGTTVVGFGTLFTRELRVGDVVSALGQMRIVAKIVNDTQLEVIPPFPESLPAGTPFYINLLFAGTVGGGIFCSANHGASWVNLNPSLTNTRVTSLLVADRPGSGTIASDWTTVTGSKTHFSLELREGDRITVNGQTRLVRSLGKQGTGTIATQGVKVTGTDTRFTELKPGDTLSVGDQTRKVVKLTPGNNTVLQIDAPFPQDLPAGTAFLLNRDTLLEINEPFQPNLSPDTSFAIPSLYAGTAGGGVLRAVDTGENWTSFNPGLGNPNITAIAINPIGQLFVGTGGGGIFRTSRKQPQERWKSVNSGLTSREITDLVIDASGHLFASTAGDGVFRSMLNGKRWRSVSETLTSPDITTLVVQPRPVTGTIASQEKTVTGEGTQFLNELKVGDRIIADEQIRTVQAIADDTHLTLETAFCPDLPLQTQFGVSNPLFAGSAEGKLFQSLDSGQTWTEFRTGSLGITALVLNLETGTLFAGTTGGNVLRSGDRGATWTSLNQGLVNVDEKLLILSRLQPGFTSTHYGDPGYAQLSQSCPDEIRTGAEDGAEMGGFNYLKQPQREANLHASLQEYLRFGLEVGIFYVT